MQMQILSEGHTLRCKDEDLDLRLRTQVYKMYAKLNEERSPVLRSIRERGASMKHDVILNKAANIERCLRRIGEVYQGRPEHLNDFTKQDSIVLNLQRACEASIDLAMAVVASGKLGVPQTSRDAFELLEQSGRLDSELADKMKAMVGFRNIAVHDYQKLNPDILRSILDLHLGDFTDFARAMLASDG